MSDTQKATAGAEFFDLRYSPMKLISVTETPIPADASEDVKKALSGMNHTTGDEVTVQGTNGKTYGPYKLDREFCRGAGKIVFVAYSINAQTRTKPLSKDELLAQNAQLIARLEELEKGRKQEQELLIQQAALLKSKSK